MAVANFSLYVPISKAYVLSITGIKWETVFYLTSRKLRTSRFGEMPERKPISQETHTCLDLFYIKEAYEGLKKKFYL